MKFRQFFESASEESGLWADMAQNPQMRLVYADWLQDNEQSVNRKYEGLLRGTGLFKVEVAIVEDNDSWATDEDVTWEQLVTALAERGDGGYRWFCNPTCGEERVARVGPTGDQPVSGSFNTGQFSFKYEDEVGHDDDYQYNPGTVLRRRMLYVRDGNKQMLPAWMYHCFLRQAAWGVQ